MKKESVLVFSGKNIGTFYKDGGIAYWRADQKHIKNCQYVFVIRNLNHKGQWSQTEDDYVHGQVYLVGRVLGAKMSEQQWDENGQKVDDRIIIQVSQYALLPHEEKYLNAWKKLTNGRQNPVAYFDTQEIIKNLSVDLNRLLWQDF